MRNIDEEFRQYREQNRLKVKLWREKRKKLGQIPQQKKSLKPKFRWHFSNTIRFSTKTINNQWIEHMYSKKDFETNCASIQHANRKRLPSFNNLLKELTPTPLQNNPTSNTEEPIIHYKSLIDYLKPQPQQSSLVQVLDLYGNGVSKFPGNSLSQFILTSNNENVGKNSTRVTQ